MPSQDEKQFPSWLDRYSDLFLHLIPSLMVKVVMNWLKTLRWGRCLIKAQLLKGGEKGKANNSTNTISL